MVRARQGQCGKKVSIGRSFIVQWLWEKVSETTSGEANFSSRFSRIILKNFSPKVFQRLGRAFHVASRETALKGETAFGPTASKSIWILTISSNLYILWNTTSVPILLWTSAKYIEILSKTHCLTCGILWALRSSIFCARIALSYVCHEATFFFSDNRQIQNVSYLKNLVWNFYILRFFLVAVIFAKLTILLPLFEGLKTRDENVVKKASNLSAT